ncbi:MAG: thiamine phosphate synthase [Fibrobacterota bacterium]
MRHIPDGFGFYGILTEPVRGYAYVAEVMVQAGVRFLQLRMKREPESEILKIAELVRRITEGTGTLFIVNDSARIAATVGADGVHLGQGDMRPDEAAAILGEDAIIGISTHNPAQTALACGLRPSYIGTGPVFRTPTKDIPDPVLGLDGLHRMLSLATVPAVAIGAVDAGNLRDVLRAGARNFSCVRPVNKAQNPEKVVRELFRICYETV